MLVIYNKKYIGWYTYIYIITDNLHYNQLIIFCQDQYYHIHTDIDPLFNQSSIPCISMYLCSTMFYVK